MATQIQIGGFNYNAPSSYSELKPHHWQRLSSATNRREIVAAVMPTLPVMKLPDNVLEVLFELIGFISEEPDIPILALPKADEWEWQQLELIREIIVEGNKLGYSWIKAQAAAEILDKKSYKYGLIAIASALEFLTRFEALFLYEMTDEQRNAGADRLLQFKYYAAADRLAKEWNMTPTQALKEKAGDAYLKMLFDLTKNDIDEQLQENNS